MSRRLGLTVGLWAAGVSALLPLASQAEYPASVVFLVDNSESMLDFQQYLPEAYTPGYYQIPSARGPQQKAGLDTEFGYFMNTGCDDPALVSAMSWFDKSSADPAKNGSVVYDADPDLETPFFDPDKFYQARGRRIAWQVEDFPYSLSADSRVLNAIPNSLYACYQLTNWATSDGWYESDVMNECQRCLDTKGWWRGPLITPNTSSNFNDDDFPANRKASITGEGPPAPEAYRKWIVSGRVLNVRPPKFAVARKVLKDIISTASNVRMAVATFGKDHGWYDPPEMLATMRPSCDFSYPTINEAALNRPALKIAVNHVEFRNVERSIGEALFGLGGYFSSQQSDNQWGSWFQQPFNPGFGWPGCCNGGTYDSPYTGQVGATWGAASDEWLKPPKTVGSAYLPGQPWEGYVADRSVCFHDQPSAVIVLTGGRPVSDNSVPITQMMSILTANGARHPDGTLLTFDPSNPETNTNPGGVNYCHLFGSTKEACDYTDYNWPTGLATTNKNLMDDVAFFLSHTDLRGDMPGSQTVRTFVVGYGDSHPMLQSIALAGQGCFYRADQPATLKDALSFALGDSSASACSAP